MQLVLEDDFQLHDKNGDFLYRLHNSLSQLPESWDMLWLNHGSSMKKDPDWALGPFVGHGVRIFKENVYSLGIIYRTKFALRVLNDAQIGNRALDNLFSEIVQLGGLNGFVADPPLMDHHTLQFTSTVENG